MNISRLRALILKEFKQMTRDPSSFLIGIIIPLMLIFLIGHGLSMDVKNISVAVVLEDTSPTARDTVSFLDGSPYFIPRYETSMQDAEKLMSKRKVDVILYIPPVFTSRLYRGRAPVQVILYGVDTTIANAADTYIQQGLQDWETAHAADFIRSAPSGKGRITTVTRQWFNDANTSSWMFIPGLIVLVMTIVGMFLTSLVMSREWERGTLESLFVTPVRPLEIILAKTIPYFCVAVAGLCLSLLTSRYVYEVPLHGELFLILLASMEYILAAIGMGLTISSVVKSQFLAAQLSLIFSMLPTVMLSGFIFDLRSVPAAIGYIGHILPATYYMELLKSLFLTGTNWPLILKNCTVLAGYVILFLLLTLKVTKKEV